ncbi:MAG: PIN domain-containing protein [Chloroflexi bacterium]|nr:PIN domain-containing protein [Chloroflexota bacterium]
MILADTSAWLEYDRASGTAVHHRMVQLIESDERRLSITEPVMMEVLAGARDNRRELDLRRLLLGFPLLRFDTAADFDAAVRIDRRCRSVGITPRGMIDCLIAAVAWRHGASVLAQDVDLIHVCRVIGIQLDQASART